MCKLYDRALSKNKTTIIIEAALFFMCWRPAVVYTMAGEGWFICRFVYILSLFDLSFLVLGRGLSRRSTPVKPTVSHTSSNGKTNVFPTLFFVQILFV
jgi:hypothetical protein